MSEDIKLNIESQVKGQEEIKALSEGLEKLGELSLEITDEAEGLNRALDNLAKAGQLADALEESNQALAKTETALKSTSQELENQQKAVEAVTPAYTAYENALRAQSRAVNDFEKKGASLTATLSAQQQAQQLATSEVLRIQAAYSQANNAYTAAKTNLEALKNTQGVSNDAIKQQEKVLQAAQSEMQRYNSELGKAQTTQQKSAAATENTVKALKENNAAYDQAVSARDEYIAQNEELITQYKSVSNTAKDQAKSVKDLEKNLEKQKDKQKEATQAIDQASSSVKKLATDEKAFAAAAGDAEKAQGRLAEQMRELSKMANNRDLLGIKSHKAVKNEINKVEQAYKDLKASGQLSYKELAQANNAMKTKVAELKAEAKGASSSFNQSKVALAGLVAAGAALTKMASDAIAYEAAMADVAKVMDATDAEVEALSDQLLNMSRHLPVSATGLAAIAASAAQLGTAKEDIGQFVELVAMMGTAFDISADSAGGYLANLKNIFNLSLGELELFGDAINELGNNTNAREKDIIEVLTRIGGTAQQIGLTREETAALAATMLSMGKDVGTAGTAINALLTRLNTAGSQGDKFKDALGEIGISAAQLGNSLRTDASGAIESVFEAINKLDGSRAATVLTDLFGMEHQAAAALLAQGVDKLSENFKRVADSSQYAGAMVSEFKKRSETAEAQLQLFKNSMTALSITLGSQFLPYLNQVANGAQSAVDGLARFAALRPDIADTAIKIGAVVAALKTTVVAFNLLKTAAAPTLDLINAANNKTIGGMEKLGVSTDKATKAMRMLGTATALYAAFEMGKGIGSWLKEEFAIVEYVSIGIIENIMWLSNRIQGYWAAVRGFFADGREGWQREIAAMNDAWEAEKQIFQEMKDDAFTRERGAAAEQRKKELEAEKEKVVELGQTYGEMAVIRRASMQDKGDQDAYINNLKLIDESLQKMGLSYKSVLDGMNESTKASINAFGDLAVPLAALNTNIDKTGQTAKSTGEILRQSFVATLKEIKSPEELALFLEKIKNIKDASGLSGEALKNFNGIIDDMEALLKSGVTAGEAFNAALELYKTNAQQAAEGVEALNLAQQRLRQELEREASNIERGINNKIRELNAIKEVAERKGDEARVRELNTKIMELEAEKGTEVAAVLEQQLKIDEATLASINAKVEAGAVLSTAEAEYAEKLRISIEDKKTEIVVLQESAKAKQLDAEASKNQVEQINSLTDAQKAQQQQQKSLNEISANTARIGVDVEQITNKQESSFRRFAGSVGGFQSNFQLFSEAWKDYAKTINSVENLTKGQRIFAQQAQDFKALAAEVSNTDDVTAQLITTWRQAIKSLYHINDADLSGLIAEIDRAEQRLMSLRDTARDTLESIEDRLDRLKGKEDEVARRANERELRELEAKLKEARESGDMATVDYYQQAIAKLKEAHALEKRRAEEEKRERAARDRENQSSNQGSSSSQGGKATASRHEVVFKSDSGESANAYVDDEEMAARLIKVLKQHALKSNQR